MGNDPIGGRCNVWIKVALEVAAVSFSRKTPWSVLYGEPIHPRPFECRPEILSYLMTTEVS